MSSEISPAVDVEFEAMKTIYDALVPLDDDARGRVIKYITSRLDISVVPTSSSTQSFVGAAIPDTTVEEGEGLEAEQALAPKYPTFAELYDAAQPKTAAEKALVAGYWLQVCQGQQHFDGFSANKELKNLGEGLANITAAIDSLKNQKPALALQLKKSGKSQQARKTYKLTVSGIKAVEGMING